VADSVWWDDIHVSEGQRLAIQEAFFSYVVGVFGPGGTNPATGTLVKWKQRVFILTASHVLEGARLDDLRFHTRDKGPVVETTPEEAFRKYGPATRVGEKLDISKVVAESNQYHDDIAIAELSSLSNVSREAGLYTLIDTTVNVTDGASVFIVGYASANSIAFGPGRRGLIATGDSALFDSALNARTDLNRYYDSSRHFLVPYTRTDDGIEPHGLSGAGAWCNANSHGTVWTARPILVGVVTRWHRKRNLLQITNLESILELFRQIT
jgi:hypothetical protein